jgi:hypothetical protein
MTIERAAELLQERLSKAPWLVAVGTGEVDGHPSLYLYVNTVRKAELNFLQDGWEGFPVEIRRTGTPRPAPTHQPIR